MRFLLSTQSSSSCLPLEQQFALAAETGFDGVEYLVLRTHWLVEAARLKEASRQQGVPIVNVHAPFEPVEGWGSQAETVLRAVDLARELGAGSITFHPPRLAIPDDDYLRWFESVRDFQAEVGGGDLAITLENMPRPTLWRRIRSFGSQPYIGQGISAFEQVLRQRNLLMTFDTTHLGTARESLITTFDKLRDRVRTIHLSNYRNAGAQEHLPVDQGELDLAGFLRHTQRCGYEGNVTLEVFPFYLQSHPQGTRGALAQFARWRRETLALPAPVARAAGTRVGQGQQSLSEPASRRVGL